MTGYSKFTLDHNDPRFPSFLQGFNRRWYAGSCEAVYVCHDAEGTAAALDDAIALYGAKVKIKSGGHCYENFVFYEETKAVIDVTGMAGAGYDPEKGYYLDSGGTNWGAFQSVFRDYGKVLPGGSCYSVGLGGHICGGGYGLLSRLNGLTVDWLTGVEVVVKKDANQPATVVYVSKDSKTQAEQDLFWAHCGGGGGNFGVITRYYFKTLPDSPASAFITQLSIDWTDIPDYQVLSQLLDFIANLAENPNNWRQFGILALHHISHGEVVLTIQTAVLPGENPEDIRSKYVDHLLDRIQTQIAPVKPPSKPAVVPFGYFSKHDDHTQQYTFYEVVQTLNGSGSNQRGKYKSAYMRKGFPADQAEAIFNHLTCSSKYDFSQCLLQIDTYGGKINTVDPDATAIPQRSSILKLQYQAYWAKASDDQIYLDWIREFYTDVYKNTGGTPNPDNDPTDNVDGCYFNYPDVDLNAFGGRNAALKLYFGNNLDRLKRAKRTWDPNNYFNSAQSIPVE